MDEIAMLRTENERLRELLIENDINPEPEPAYVPLYGPPTSYQHTLNVALAALGRDLLGFMPMLYAEINSPRIRLPNGYCSGTR
jgi:hypothetical protein